MADQVELLRLSKMTYHGIKNSHIASSVDRRCRMLLFLAASCPHGQLARGCTISQGRSHGNPCPILSKTYPPSRTTASVTKGWRIVDLNYFLCHNRSWLSPYSGHWCQVKNKVVVCVGLWVIWRPCAKNVPHACSHGLHCFKKHPLRLCPPLPSLIVPF